MQISIDEVMDYIACPMLYKYRYVLKMEPPQPKRGRAQKNSVIEVYEKALKKMAHYIFNSIQDGRYPTIANMAKAWGNVWIKPRASMQKIEYAETSWRDTHQIKERQGWNHTRAMQEFFKDNHGSPIMVNYKYDVEIGNHRITGSIDLVETVKNKKGGEDIILTHFLVDEKRIPNINIRRDWTVTAASYAFEKLIKVRESKIVYHGIVSGKHHNTVRDEDDYKQLEFLIDTIAKTIEMDLFYPRINERCYSCPFQKTCEKGWFDVKD